MSIFAVTILSVFFSIPVSPTQRVPSFISAAVFHLLSTTYGDYFFLI